MATPQSVLVPLTGSVEPERLVRTACSLADEDASVTAIVVVEISALLPLDARMDDEEARARVLLGRARAAGEECGVRVVPRIVRARSSALAILAVADEERAELVVLGSRRHRGRRLERRLLRQARCPVLVVAA
jgi:nucleotide-binding universal stress UspA family protein